MSEQYPGGFVSKAPPTPQGAYQDSLAYGIWSMSQQAFYQKNNLWPIPGNIPPSALPDAKFNYVAMLLNGNGVNAAQNNTFLDSSANSFTINRNGNTTQGSFSPYGNNWSNYFNGSTTASINFSAKTFTGDFTWECWYLAQALGSNSGNYTMLMGELSTTNVQFSVKLDGSVGYYNSVTYTELAAAGTIVVGVWYHLALVRSGSTTTLFVNGVLKGSQTDSGTRKIAVVGNILPYSDQFAVTGYLSNVRLNTTALYSTAFTPSTTPLTAVSGTVLLTCQSNRFVDNSSAATALTVLAATSIQRFNPFGESVSYSTATYGGSGYFDGSGDYLSVADSSALQLRSSQFTIDGWFYTSVSGTDSNYPISQVAGLSESSINWFVRTLSSNKFRLVLMVGSSPTVLDSTSNIQINAWNYFAVTCDGTGAGANVRMWLNGVYQGVAVFDISTLNNNTAATVVGSWVASGNYMTGFLTDIRVIKGTALYTGTGDIALPTTPATAVANTQLLCKMTNAAIYDSAMIADAETAGNTQISTSVYKYGTGSIYNPATTSGSGLKCYLGSNGIIKGDYTLEWWAYHNNLSTGSNHVMIGPWGSQYLVRVDNGTNLQIYIASAQRLSITTAASGITATTWQHYAIVRSGSACAFYVDGVQKGTWTQTGTVDLSTISVAAENAGVSTAPDQLNGYMDDVRLTNGYARYTTAFTPPTNAFPTFGPN